MDKEFISGLMAGSMKVNIITIRSMDSANTNILMADHIKVNGPMANRMVKVYLLRQQELNVGESGRMAKGLIG